MWTLIDRLDDVYRDIADIVYTNYCTRIEVSVLRAGRGVGWGGWKFLVTEKKNSLRNVPGVLKRKSFFPYKFKKKKVPGILKRTQIFFLGGEGNFGVFGAPHDPTRGSHGVGKRYTSSYDHDLWPVKILAVKNYHPETLAAEE